MSWKTDDTLGRRGDINNHVSKIGFSVRGGSYGKKLE